MGCTTGKLSDKFVELSQSTTDYLYKKLEAFYKGPFAILDLKKKVRWG